MKRINLKQYFKDRNTTIRSLLIICLLCFFTTFFICDEMPYLNYSTYPFALAIGFLTIYYFYKNKIKPDLRPMVCIYVFVGIVYLVSFIANPKAAITYRTMLVLAVFSTALYLSCFIIKDTKLVMRLFIIAGLLLMFTFIAIYFKQLIKLEFLSVRLGGKIGNENAVAMKMVAVSIILGSYIAYNKKYILIPILFVLFICIISSGSKKGLFGILFATITTIYLIFRKKPIIAAIVIVAACLTFYCLLWYVPQFALIKNRLILYISGKQGGATDSSSYIRDLFKENALYLSFKNLLLGYGVGGFSVASGINTYSHNNFTELLCNFGLFGFISFHFIYVYLILKLKPKMVIKNETVALYFILLFYFVILFGAIEYYSKIIYICFALCLYLNYENENIIKTKQITI